MMMTPAEGYRRRLFANIAINNDTNSSAGSKGEREREIDRDNSGRSKNSHRVTTCHLWLFLK